jgi:UTP:GlnB (protein PII) uridylyltransferase
VTVTDGVDCRWVDVVARDRHGLLAASTGALADLDLEISHAVVATWPDGAALQSFCVRSPERPDPAVLEQAVEAGLDGHLASPPLPGAVVTFDHHASPWHTAAEVEAPDQPHLLHQLATAFAAAGVDVAAATVTGRDGRAYDSFLLDGPAGAKLVPADESAVVRVVAAGVVTRRRRLRRPVYVPAPAPTPTPASASANGATAAEAPAGDLTPR